MRISGEKTMRVPLAGDATMGISLPPCPVCQTPGVPGEFFCLECGLLIGSSVGTHRAARPLPKLVDSAGREFPLLVGASVVGRDSAEVILPSKTVSRRHAVIRVTDSGGVSLEDTNSTNGTKLGGARITSGQAVALTDGAVVQFGDIYLKVVIPDSAPATSFPALESFGAGAAGSALVPTPEAPTARLTAENGAIFVLSEGTTSFGRRPSNRFVLGDDSFVSGAHAVIEQENGRCYLIDLNSTNGTRLNGRRIAPNLRELLQEGDAVIFGQTPFTFHSSGE